jgi:hypothetical protein
LPIVLPTTYLHGMNPERRFAPTAGRVVLLTSLLCLVLVLAVAVAGPALALAIFSVVLLLSALAPIPRVPAAVPVTARRLRFPPRAPPLF